MHKSLIKGSLKKKKKFKKCPHPPVKSLKEKSSDSHLLLLFSLWLRAELMLPGLTPDRTVNSEIP